MVLVEKKTKQQTDEFYDQYKQNETQLTKAACPWGEAAFVWTL